MVYMSPAQELVGEIVQGTAGMMGRICMGEALDTRVRSCCPSWLVGLGVRRVSDPFAGPVAGVAAGPGNCGVPDCAWGSIAAPGGRSVTGWRVTMLGEGMATAGTIGLTVSTRRAAGRVFWLSRLRIAVRTGAAGATTGVGG